MTKSKSETTVFLGGTYVSNTTSWREDVISKLRIRYINPEKIVSKNFFAVEKHERLNSDYCLFVLTPESYNFAAIAEVVQESNNRPNKTILCVIRDYMGCYFDDASWYSMECVKEIVRDNGAIVVDTLDEAISFLNTL